MGPAEVRKKPVPLMVDDNIITLFSVVCLFPNLCVTLAMSESSRQCLVLFCLISILEDERSISECRRSRSPDCFPKGQNVCRM